MVNITITFSVLLFFFSLGEKCFSFYSSYWKAWFWKANTIECCLEILQVVFYFNWIEFNHCQERNEFLKLKKNWTKQRKRKSLRHRQHPKFTNDSFTDNKIGSLWMWYSALADCTYFLFLFCFVLYITIQIRIDQIDFSKSCHDAKLTSDSILLFFFLLSLFWFNIW